MLNHDLGAILDRLWDRLEPSWRLHFLGVCRSPAWACAGAWLWRVPMIVTNDETAKWDSNEPWMRESMFEVALSGPSWVDAV